MGPLTEFPSARTQRKWSLHLRIDTDTASDVRTLFRILRQCQWESTHGIFCHLQPDILSFY